MGFGRMVIPLTSQLHSIHSLSINEPIHYGSWCQRSNPLSYQDILVSEWVRG